MSLVFVGLLVGGPSPKSGVLKLGKPPEYRGGFCWFPFGTSQRGVWVYGADVLNIASEPRSTKKKPGKSQLLQQLGHPLSNTRCVSLVSLLRN